MKNFLTYLLFVISSSSMVLTCVYLFIEQYSIVYIILIPASFGFGGFVLLSMLVISFGNTQHPADFLTSTARTPILRSVLSLSMIFSIGYTLSLIQ